MVIDIHSHCYLHPTPFVTRFLSPEELIKKNKELGIDKAVLLPVVNPEIYLPQSGLQCFGHVESQELSPALLPLLLAMR